MNAHMQTSTINRLLSEMLCIVILATENGDGIFK